LQLLETNPTGTVVDRFFGVLGVVLDGSTSAALDMSELTALRRALLLCPLFLLLFAPSCVSTMLLRRLRSRRSASSRPTPTSIDPRLGSTPASRFAAQ
jgi:hypothetical protein